MAQPAARNRRPVPPAHAPQVGALTLCAVLGLLTWPGAGEAQTRTGTLPADVSVELRGGVTMPGSDLGDGVAPVQAPAAAVGGIAFGGDVMIGFTPRLLGYFGWGRASFDCDADVDCAADEELNSDGFDAGLVFRMRPASTVRPWLRGGAIFHRFEFEDAQQDLESDSSLGFELGAGVDVQISDLVSLVPAARYRRYSADFTTVPGAGGVGAMEADIDWFQIDVGLRLHLFRGGGSMIP